MGGVRLARADTNDGVAARLLLIRSPLTGRGAWNLVAAELARAGYEPEVPDLTGVVGGGPPYCVRLARRIGAEHPRRAGDPDRSQPRRTAAGHGRSDGRPGRRGLHLRRCPLAHAGAGLDGDGGARPCHSRSGHRCGRSFR